VTILQLDFQPDLIDQVHDRLLAAIVDGTLAPGRRLTQENIAAMLGVSRQPVSHAMQVLRRRGLLVDAGKRGVAVAPIDAARIRGLYQVREALDVLASELAAARVRAKSEALRSDLDATRALVAEGLGFDDTTPMARRIDADVAFHTAIHDLSGNPVIAETVKEQWPHFRRSMGVVLGVPEIQARVWLEHRGILDAIADGRAADAGRLAREHTAGAGEALARRIEDQNTVA
jgi:DNA-binding GntR family transcriptional regulator